MTMENFEPKKEKEKSIVSVPPAVELLSDPATAAKFWPKQVAENAEFLSQLESRKKLNDRLDDVISNLPRPDVSLQEAISEGALNEQQVADLYTSLSTLLEEGQDYERIVLYLPFEFLPSAEWKAATDSLQQEAARFQEAYMAAWDGLLMIRDVRANFVDGDVLEVEKRDGDLPRVVKAAHLIPKLVEKGLLNMEEVYALADEEDEILKQSVLDTFPVLYDMGLIKKDILDKYGVELSESKKETKPQEITVVAIEDRLKKEFKVVDEAEYGDVTKSRKSWLIQEGKKRSLEGASDDIKVSIATGGLDDKVVADFIGPEVEVASQQALVSGVRKAIEEVANTDVSQAKELYAKYREGLMTLWNQNVSEVRLALSKTFSRLNGLDVVDDDQLRELGIAVPALAGPLSRNLEAMQPEMEEVKKAVAAIEADAEISKFIYPVVLVFGSRLKGYGNDNSDIDVGVFVKPGTSQDDQEKIRDSLSKIFTDDKLNGGAIEFWLEEGDGEMAVQDSDTYDPSVMDSSAAHVLFGAAWEGNEEAISELREKVVAPYFYDDGKKVHGRDVRKFYMESIERDTLQYRLMHRGYEELRPSYGGVDAEHSDRIDGESMFWDSGYRQTATKLFASRVFVPKISRPE